MAACLAALRRIVAILGDWGNIEQRRSQGATGRGLEHADADANSEEPWRFRCLFNSSVRLARFKNGAMAACLAALRRIVASVGD